MVTQAYVRARQRCVRYVRPRGVDPSTLDESARDLQTGRGASSVKGWLHRWRTHTVFHSVHRHTCVREGRSLRSAFTPDQPR